MSDVVMTYEDWLRGCVHHDGRHGYVTLPCDEVLKIADFIERLRADRKDESSDYGKPNNCETCKNWDVVNDHWYFVQGCHYEPRTMYYPQVDGITPSVIEPQKCYLRKSCDHYGDKQVCGRCRHYNLYSHTKTEPLTLKGGEDVHEFCKKCDESKARLMDGERYIVCGKVSDLVCVSMKECPLGKWVCEDTYIIVPQMERSRR